MARTKHVLIRVSEEELKQIKQNAKKQDMTVSDYLRKLGCYVQVLEYDTSYKEYGNTVKISEVK